MRKWKVRNKRISQLRLVRGAVGIPLMAPGGRKPVVLLPADIADAGRGISLPGFAPKILLRGPGLRAPLARAAEEIGERGLDWPW